MIYLKFKFFNIYNLQKVFVLTVLEKVFGGTEL